MWTINVHFMGHVYVVYDINYVYCIINYGANIG